MSGYGGGGYGGGGRGGGGGYGRDRGDRGDRNGYGGDGGYGGGYVYISRCWEFGVSKATATSRIRTHLISSNTPS